MSKRNDYVDWYIKRSVLPSIFRMGRMGHRRWMKEGGSVSELGYSQGSPYRGKPYLDIETPEGLIDMSNTDIPLYAEDETGMSKLLMPFSGMHKFRGSKVREVPIVQKGGFSQRELYDFLFEDEVETPKGETVTAPSEEEVQIQEQEIAAKERKVYERGMEEQFALDLAMQPFGESRATKGQGNPYKFKGADFSLSPTSGNPFKQHNSFSQGDLDDNEISVIKGVASKHGVPANILAGVYGAETNYGNNVRPSSAGAQGYFQFMPGTAKELGVNPMDFNSSADGAARYLSQLHKQFGSWDKAIAAYNAGPGNVQKGRYPAETQAYVPKVLNNAQRLSNRFELGGFNPYKYF